MSLVPLSVSSNSLSLCLCVRSYHSPPGPFPLSIIQVNKSGQFGPLSFFPLYSNTLDYRLCPLHLSSIILSFPSIALNTSFTPSKSYSSRRVCTASSGQAVVRGKRPAPLAWLTSARRPAGARGRGGACSVHDSHSPEKTTTGIFYVLGVWAVICG